MHPVKTQRANFTFLGDGETVGDVWVERREIDGTTRLTYEPSDSDREVLAAGGRVEMSLWIGHAKMPPVSLVVLTEAETHPVGEHYEHPMGPDRGIGNLPMTAEKLHQIVYEAAGAATAPLLADHPDYVFPSERVGEAVNAVLAEHGIPAVKGYRREPA